MNRIHLGHTVAVAALAVCVLGGLSGPALAAQARQTPPRAAEAPAPAPPVSEQDARETRERLHSVLDQYPPALAEVLRLDPSLLARPDYVAAYPALAAFLGQHPEAARNPSYFFGGSRVSEPESSRRQAINLLEEVLGGMAFLAGFVVLLTALTWVIRSLIDYRRWKRLLIVQTDAHTKLLDRFNNNDDLMAYIQTPAARRFLESAPIPDQGPRPFGAPLGRILWSVQAGVILVSMGVGLWFVKNNVIEEIAPPIYILGVVAIALGIGFSLSAVVAYGLSLRLGLLEPPKS
jgi:hypothetical protein